MTKIISMEEYLNKKEEQKKIEKCKGDFCSFADYCLDYDDKVELSTGETYSPSKFRSIIDSMYFHGS